MRYGIWRVLYTSNTKYDGTAPNKCEGAFFLDNTNTTVAGYIQDDLDISDVSNWYVEEITLEQFTSLLTEINPNAELLNGKVKAMPRLTAEEIATLF